MVPYLYRWAVFLVQNLDRMDVALVVDFCTATFLLHSKYSFVDNIYELGTKICLLCLKPSKQQLYWYLDIMKVALKAMAMAMACKDNQEETLGRFLKLVDTCTNQLGHASMNDIVSPCSNKVASMFSGLATEHFSEDNASVACVLELYATVFVIKDFKLYQGWDKDIKSIREVLFQMEGRLNRLKQETTIQACKGCYMIASNLLYDRLPLLIASEFANLIDGPIMHLPVIEDAFHERTFAFLNEWESKRQKDMDIGFVGSTVGAYFIITLTTNTNTKRIDALRKLIEVAGLELLFPNMYDVSAALHKLGREQEAINSLELCCQAAWNSVLRFCRMFSTRKKGDFMEDTIVGSVRKASEYSSFYLDMLKNSDPKKMHKMATHFVQRYLEAQSHFLILSPVGLFEQWMKIQFEKIQDPEAAHVVLTVYSLMSSPSLQISEEALVIILEQELLVCKNMERGGFDSSFCEAYQKSILENFVDVHIDRKDCSLKRCKNLVVSGTQLRALGGQGVKDCIEYISEAIDMMKCEGHQLAHLIAEAYSLRALCTRETKLKSKIWLNQGLSQAGDLTLLFYVSDLLALEGHMIHHSSINDILMECFSRRYSLAEWVPIFIISRQMSHSLCNSPVYDAFISKFAKYDKCNDEVSFWINCIDCELLKVGFQRSFSVSETLSSPYSEATQAHITMDKVKQAALDLITKDSSSELNSFLAAYIFFELSEEMIGKGLLSEALTYAVKSYELRLRCFTSSCTLKLSKNQFHVKTTPACSYEIPFSCSNFHMTPWHVLRCLLESNLQVGSIYILLGDRMKAGSSLRNGKKLSSFFNLPIFLVRFSCELGKLYHLQWLWNTAKVELKTAEKNLDASCNLISCQQCKAILKVTFNQQRGDFLFDNYIKRKTLEELDKLETSEKLDEVERVYKAAELLLDGCEWVNDVSSPQELVKRKTVFCNVINVSHDNTACVSKDNCWHCQPLIVTNSSSLTSCIYMKRESLRRRLLLRVLSGKGKCYEARGQIADERKLLFYSISVLVSRSTFHASHYDISPTFLSTLIEANLKGVAFEIEYAMLLYQICCLSLRCIDDKATSENISMPTIVAGLKLSYILSCEVPAICQKVSRLLSVLYTLSASHKKLCSVLSKSNSLSQSQWAAYFQQASMGRHFNRKFHSRLDSCAPGSRSHCVRLPLQHVDHLEALVLQFFEDLPCITIVCISFFGDGIERLLIRLLSGTRDNAWIMLSRLNLGDIPISTILPIKKTLDVTVTDTDLTIYDDESHPHRWTCHWRDTLIDKIAPEFESILKREHHTILTGACKGNVSRSDLNKRLSCFLRDMEDCWLGSWKKLFHSNNMKFNDDVEEFKHALKDLCGISVDKSVLKVVMEYGWDAYKREDIQLAAAELIMTNGCYSNGLDRIEIEKSILGLIETTICNAHEKIKIQDSTFGDPMILVMDYEIQALPWESMEAIRDKEVYRMPSITSILAILSRHSSHRDGGYKQQKVFPSIDPLRSYYLLDPKGNLKFPICESWFKKLHMKGTAGTKPTQDELCLDLKRHDLYIYLGHGSGSDCLPDIVIQDLNMCAVALLMGCDSGRMELRGTMEPRATQIDYLLGGSPTIFCNLWPIVATEIDVFTKNLVNFWLEYAQSIIHNQSHDERDTHNNEPPYKERKSGKNLGLFLPQSRKDCALQYLTGAAPVTYGVPTSIKPKSDMNQGSHWGRVYSRKRKRNQEKAREEPRRS